MNLLYTIPSLGDGPLKTYFFQVHLKKAATRASSLSVGVAKRDEFQKGYRVKGMFYNGNLTNGSSTLKVSYGSRMKADDVLVIEYQQLPATKNSDGDSLAQIQLRFYQNGICLGIGFRINESSDATFFPCISVLGEMDLSETLLIKFIGSRRLHRNRPVMADRDHNAPNLPMRFCKRLRKRFVSAGIRHRDRLGVDPTTVA